MSDFNNKDINENKGRRPPGGACSDIFGPPVVAEVRRRTNNTDSTIFTAPAPSSPSPQRQKRQEDTQNKLFGEPEPLAPIQVIENVDGSATKSAPFIRVRQPPGGVASKLW